MVEADGVEISDTEEGYPADAAGIQSDEIITSINGIETTYTYNFSMVLADKKPGDIIEVKTNKNVYNVTLAANPNNSSKAYIGIYASQSTKIKESFVEKYGKYTPNIIIWLFGLFSWLYLLNLGIGLFNLVPLGPLDGGRMLLVVLQKFFKDEKAKKIWFWISSIFLMMIIANIAAAYI